MPASMPKLVGGIFSALCIAAWCVPAVGADGWARPKVPVPRLKLPKLGAPQRAAAPPKLAMPAVPVPAFRMPGSARKSAAVEKKRLARVPVPELAERRLQMQMPTCDLGSAFGAIIGMVLVYGIAHAFDARSTFHYMCDELALMERCQAAAPGECYGGCEMSDEMTCGPLWVTGARWYIEPDPGSPLSLYGQAVEYCNSLSEAACGSNGRCEWKADSMKCDLSLEMFGAVACNETFSPLLAAISKCSALAGEGPCGGEPADCSWNGEAEACEVGQLRFAQLAFGEGPGSDFYAKTQGLVPGDCGGDNACYAFLQRTGACSQVPEDSCHGECVFRGSTCEASLAAAATLCRGAGGGGGRMTCGEVKELYKASGCCGSPEKVIHPGRRLQSSGRGGTPGGRALRTEEALLRMVGEAVQAEMARGGKDAARKLADQISGVLAGRE